MSRLQLPAPDMKKMVITDNHLTGDIIQLVLNQDGKYQDQTKAFCDSLKGMTVYDQCHCIWEALRDNVKYVADRPSSQNLKSPARLFHDGSGDCKSFSLFEASCLRNLNIPYAYRFVSFRADPTPTHVYIVANPDTRKEIIMDGVLPQFDYQKPFTKKYDCPMPLSMLTGVDDYMGAAKFDPFAAVKKAAAGLKHSMDVNTKVAAQYAKDPKKLANDAKKSVNDVVKAVEKTVTTLNPISAITREGILLAMQTNLMNAAGKLKLGYLTPAQAQAKKYNMAEWTKLQKKVQDFSDNFVKNGGSAAELKAAILKGGGALNGVGCPSGARMGVAKVDVQKIIAAAIPVILALIKDFIGIDFGGMTQNAAQGFDEQQANKSSTLTQQQLADIAAGATSLAAAAADASAQGKQPGSGPGPGGAAPRKQPPPPKKSNNTLLLAGAGIAALYLYSNSK